MEHTTSTQRPSASQLAGNSQRDECVDRLSAAYADERLTRDELERRLDEALRAHTSTELVALLEDLSEYDVSNTEPAPAGSNAPSRLKRPLTAAAVFAIATLLIWITIGIAGDTGWDFLPAWLITLVGGGVGAAAIYGARSAIKSQSSHRTNP